MAVEIKFCGLTRPEDAASAVSFGASFVGVIFAGGPRALTPDRAAAVLADVPRHVKRVGVFADQRPDEIAAIAERAGLSVVQLHRGADVARIAAVRIEFGGLVWAVARIADGRIPDSLATMIDSADGVLLDALVPGALGGTGVALPWASLADGLRQIRGTRPIILAGGLRPENVAQAIAALSPDVVDVSSGVESAPGIKDSQRMRAFRDAVNHASNSL